MGKLSFAGLCTVVCCVVVGCSSPEARAPVAAEAVTSLPSSPTPTSPTLLATASGAPSTTTVPPSTEPAGAFPAGFPKVVTVRALPSQVRNWYQMGGNTKAVQLAPGGWTPLQDGAEVQDAVDAEVLDGFCSSVKAFERQYRQGRTYPGTCR